MSYNWYCYGQIKNDKDDSWKEFSKQPFSDNLKWYIDFDDVPSCFQRVIFDHEDNEQLKQDIAPAFIEEFKGEDAFSCCNAYVVRLDKFIEHFNNKIQSVYSTLSGIFKCMGINEDIDWNGDIEECIYCMLSDNEKEMKQKSVPISKTGILEIVRCINNLEKYQYLINIARVFESMAFDSHDYDNTKKSFLMVQQ